LEEVRLSYSTLYPLLPEASSIVLVLYFVGLGRLMAVEIQLLHVAIALHNWDSRQTY